LGAVAARAGIRYFSGLSSSRPSVLGPEVELENELKRARGTFEQGVPVRSQMEPSLDRLAVQAHGDRREDGEDHRRPQDRLQHQRA
jgi:hypothetical protein